MATTGEDDVAYDSDPEEAKQSLVMRRRRAASDDEDSEEEEGAEREREGPDGATRIHSDESDGQGAAADYDDEEAYSEEEEEETYNEEEELIDDEEVHGQHIGDENFRDGANEEEKVAVEAVSESAAEEFGDAPLDGQMNQEGEKVVNEPYVVPTAGAFYMHDDRYRDNARGRHRRTFGGRKLWESRDERKWGHDKFEEMFMQERHYEERRRNSRGHTRGRGRNRGVDRGYGRGNRSRTFDNQSSTAAATNNNNSDRAPMPRAVRGRGTRSYDHSLRKSNRSPAYQSKSTTKPGDKHDNPEQTFATTSNLESDSASTRKNAFGSSLSSASPPFYPSGSSNKEGSLSEKKDVQTGNSNWNNGSSAVDDNFSGAQSNSLLRGKNVANSIGMDKLRIDDVVTAFAGKPFSPMQAAPSGSPSISSSQPSQARPQGRGATPAAGQMPYQSAFPQGQAKKVSPPVHAHIQRSPVPNRVQPSAPQLGQRPGIGSQAFSPPKTAISVDSYDTAESETPSASSKSKDALVAKGKGSIQGSGRGSFIYGGAHAMGAGGPIGVGRGDQNFPATPTFLPVMQFGGQHPGGIGVPAVGMAFPGYVSQPQLGFGNSEMTWLPVLTGAAGALGAAYCSPYIAVDGSYNGLPAGQATAAGTTSKESNMNKLNNESEPQGTEAVNEEQGQRQNKARRYSEMNFGK